MSTNHRAPSAQTGPSPSSAWTFHTFLTSVMVPRSAGAGLEFAKAPPASLAARISDERGGEKHRREQGQSGAGQGRDQADESEGLHGYSAELAAPGDEARGASADAERVILRRIREE